MQSVIEKMNRLGSEEVPFLFIIDYEQMNPIVIPLKDLPGTIKFSTPRKPVPPLPYPNHQPVTFNRYPVSCFRYKQAFNQAINHILHGDTYLLNLTFPTPIETNLSLMDFFIHSQAPFRLFVENQLVVFSPEPFIRIKNNCIYSYPMKGTIDASISDAAGLILNNQKETSEHHTIVDLIRNDLSMVSSDVKVIRFRYLDRIRTRQKELIQVSSEIMGHLPKNYSQRLGTMLFTLLPAGSISGAPKQKTVEVIREAEGQPRGYFTGVFGVFDGTDLESAVMIRFIEKTATGMQFRSGGGITHQSDPQNEYQEMIDKVYVPFS